MTKRSQISILITCLLVFVVILTILYFFGDTPENLNWLIAFSEGLSVLILFTILSSYFFHHQIDFKLNTAIEGLNKEFQIRKKYFVVLYSSMATLLLALICMIYTVYSDVFYQHGDPISPIVYGIKKNKTVTNLNFHYSNKDTTNLIFLLDVSQSTNNSTCKDLSWVSMVKKLVEKKSWSGTEVEKKLSKIRPIDYRGLNLIKLKTCLLLIQTSKKLDDNKEKYYKTSILTFGGQTNIDLRFLNIANKETLSICLNKVLDLQPDPIQSNRTDLSKVDEKLSEFDFLVGTNDKFRPQKNVVTILSDFIQDSGQQGDSSVLERSIARLSSRSTYFNLYLFDLKLQKKENGINMLPFFRRLIYPELINRKMISDTTEDLRSCYFLSEDPIVIITEKPFYVQNKYTTLKIPSDKFNIMIQGCDEKQQLRLNGDIIKNEVNYDLNKGDNKLAFEGHSTGQFSGIRVYIYMPQSLTTVSYEIVFKKGLRFFVSFMALLIGYLLLVISCFYFYNILTIKEPPVSEFKTIVY